MGKGGDTQKMSLQNRQKPGLKGYFVFPLESQKEELLMWNKSKVDMFIFVF